MSEREDPSPEASEPSASSDASAVEPEIDSVAEEKMRDLLRGALGREPQPPPEREVLRGVQRRLRERSRGKFYADGWSTAKQPPIGTFLVTSAIMLAIVLVTYAILHFQVGEAMGVPMTPAPVPVRIVFTTDNLTSPAPPPPTPPSAK